MKRILTALIFAAVSIGSVYAQEPAPKKAVEAGNMICPVSGERVDSMMTKATYVYEGKIYNFCCPMCIDTFKKDPEKYIEKIEQEKTEESTQGHSEEMHHHH